MLAFVHLVGVLELGRWLNSSVFLVSAIVFSSSFRVGLTVIPMKLGENHSWKSHHSCSQKQFCLSESSNWFGFFFFFLIFLLFKDLSVNVDNVAFKLLCVVTLTHKSAIAAGNLIWIKSKCPCKRMLLTGKYMKIVITCSNAMTQIYLRLVWNMLTHPTCTNYIRCSPSIAI